MRKKMLLGKKRCVALTLALVLAMGLTGCGAKEETKSGSKSDENFVYEYPAQQENGIKYDETEAAVMDDVSAPTYDVAADCCEEYYEEEYYDGYVEDYNTNEFEAITENSWCSVATTPFSTFAADVDTASYSTLRNDIMNGYEVYASAIRIEEMINYFHYDYEEPKGNEKFGVYTEYADCPWNEDTQLALVSLNTEDIDFSEAPDSNLVFLIDTSGSMYDENKLPLVQQSLTMLVENLGENDRISIVTYAGSDTVVLEGVSGDNYYEITSAIDSLEAGGSTNGAAGIETAYEIAEKYYIEDGNNRVILATDGDLNVGITSESQLEELIVEKKETGVYLSVLGFGYGNYKDTKLETLADNGNGNYAYIDSIFEAKKALVDDMGANLITVAKDVKLQVEFNPALVKGYRLIGYENRAMATEDFSDDTKDGGEMGAGHCVTAIYEIVPIDSDMEITTTESKYNNTDSTYEEGKYNDELFTVSVRYKEPDEDESKLSSYVCTTDDYNKKGSDNLRWAASVAAFGMYLKDSEYMGDTDIDLILELATSVEDYKEDDYKAEFIDMVEMYDDVR